MPQCLDCDWLVGTGFFVKVYKEFMNLHQEFCECFIFHDSILATRHCFQEFSKSKVFISYKIFAIIIQLFDE